MQTDPTEPLSRTRFPWNGVMPRFGERADRSTLLAFIDSCLRGVGQILFANNPVSGLLILCGIFAASAWLGVATLVGVVASTATAHLLRLDRSRIRAGLYGYNGALVGGALATFLLPAWSPSLLLYAVVASAMSTLVMVAVSLVLVDQLHLPPLTLPFNLVTLPCLLVSFTTTHLHHSPMLVRHVEGPINTALREGASGVAGSQVGALLEAVLRGVGQIVFADVPLAGVLILLGLLVWSRIGALFALVGSVVGLIVGMLLGGDGHDAYHGLWGYNAMVAAEALAGVFLVWDWKTALYGVVGAAAATGLYAGLAALFGPLGLPALTLPFCLATLVFLALQHASPVFRAVPLPKVTSPEEHLPLRR